MRTYLLLILTVLMLHACSDTGDQNEISSSDMVNWQNRAIDLSKRTDTLVIGATYLSVYSHIYSETEHKTHPLTSTVSMKNTNRTDSVYITKAEYFNTAGQPIRTYFNEPIFLAPMETVEIVIDQEDLVGGSGANFIFDWVIKPDSHAPLFEAVMISTYGQQGLSFTTQGHELQ